MPAHLLIRDGSPDWWESPDLWVVPGSDPNGTPGNPIAGKQAFLWAHVANTGDVDVQGARVDFYWADPTTQIVQGEATQIGSSYVDLPAGDAKNVLCLTPWKPTFVNAGHECILGIVHAPAAYDPNLPDPLPPSFNFNPTVYDEIAQRNVSVLTMMDAPLAITIGASQRANKVSTLTVRLGGELGEKPLRLLGLDGFRPALQGAIDAGLAHKPTSHPPEGSRRSHELELRIPRGTSNGAYLTVHPRNLRGRQYGLVRVEERCDGQIVGGITYVAVCHDDDQGEAS